MTPSAPRPNATARSRSRRKGGLPADPLAELSGRSLLEALSNPALILDEGENVVAANQAALKLLGANAVAELTLPVAQTSPGGPFLPAAQWLAAIQNGRSLMLSGLPGRYRVETGLVGGLALRLLILRPGAEDPVLEGQLVAARTELLSAAAHRFGSPLAALRMHLDLLRHQLEKRGPEPRIQSCLKVMHQQIARLTTHLQEVLDLAELRLRRLSLQPMPTELVSLVGRLVSELAGHRPERPLLFQSELPRLLGCWDPPRLAMAFRALLDNAERYSPADRPVRVRLGRLPGIEDGVALTIEDEGPGVPEEMVRRVRDPLWQGETLRPTGAGTGLGLGLFMARELIQLHAGELHLEPRAEGGTRVLVTLPLQTPSLEADRS